MSAFYSHRRNFNFYRFARTARHLGRMARKMRIRRYRRHDGGGCCCCGCFGALMMSALPLAVIALTFALVF